MLNELIREGDDLKAQIQEGMGCQFLNGEDYEKWIAKCIIFLKSKHPKDTLTKRFLKASEDTKIEAYHTMIGILKALKETEDIINNEPQNISNTTGW